MWLPTLFLPLLVTLLALSFGIGFFLLSALFDLKRSTLTVWEKLLYAFALSQSFLIFGMIAIGTFGVKINIFSLTLLITLGSTLCFILFLVLTKRSKEKPLNEVGITFRFSRIQTLCFVAIVFATILIKTIYLSGAIMPTATDLGHHLYWSKSISETGNLPVYAEQNIVMVDGDPSVTAPEPISDFIIGEHLTLAAINIYSQADYFGAFPILFLYLINLLALLALAMLAFYFVRGMTSKLFSPTLWTGENAFLATLLMFGPLYSLASPQAKFVSGGVIGNTFGNLFIPLILLCFYRALRTKDSRFLGLALLFTFTLAYIHHLSTFILLFILTAIIITHLVIHWRNILKILLSWWQLLAKPLPLFILSSIILFAVFVALPSYIQNSAIDTAVGSPTKTTRTGLTLTQVASSSGNIRLAFALFGLLFFTLVLRPKRYAYSFLFGWLVILLIMTLRPELLYVDIPSSRIGAYLSFPIGLLSALSLLGLLAFIKQKKFPLPRVLVLIFFTLFISIILSEGSSDNSSTLTKEDKTKPAVAMIHASTYLATHTSSDDRIVKDHNFIVGDAWMKLFFMRGYSYPFSRAYFGRYETNPDREQCTLAMISTPNTKDGERCFQGTGVNFVVVDSTRDTAQFGTSRKFSKIYSSRFISIYQRNN